MVINNAGVATFQSALTGSIDAIENEMNTNYWGTLNLIRAFSGIIKTNAAGNGGGSIVNVISVLAHASMPALGGYCASKAATYQLTLSVRKELSEMGIQLHAVLPGPIDTDMIRDVDMPKTSPAELARVVIEGVKEGAEVIYPDQMSQAAHAVWLQNPTDLEKRFGSM